MATSISARDRINLQYFDSAGTLDSAEKDDSDV